MLPRLSFLCVLPKLKNPARSDVNWRDGRCFGTEGQVRSLDNLSRSKYLNRCDRPTNPMANPDGS